MHNYILLHDCVPGYMHYAVHCICKDDARKEIAVSNMY